ncbi:hypothetical protein [Pedobacter sp. ASV28]|jgi:hypothetical protein|uniref:hypothetical protein n=1 Tax=Pedobacter sp. ASV28 TaxID=2795123 RepID=UPI0018EA8C5A|nr:hypothetical protein [Pedobacter sp. ASV28]
MTARKALYLAIKNKLTEIDGLEYVGAQRNQFAEGNEGYPAYWTTCLIKIGPMQWNTMVEQHLEGLVTVEIYLYTKDGMAEALFSGTDDGEAEIDLIEEISDKLQFLVAGAFRSLIQTADDHEEVKIQGITCRKISFSTSIDKVVAPKYEPKSISIS